MRFEGHQLIDAPRAAVWSFVMDPEKVASCAPDAESVEVQDATHYRVVAKVGVGFIRARFTVKVELTEALEPDRAALRARGHAPGSAVEASATMTLSGPPGGPTRLDWIADATIHGTIASVGARLIEGTAYKIADQVFVTMRAKIEAGAAA